MFCPITGLIHKVDLRANVPAAKHCLTCRPQVFFIYIDKLATAFDTENVVTFSS